MWRLPPRRAFRRCRFVLAALALSGSPAAAQQPERCPDAAAPAVEAVLDPDLRAGVHEVVVNGVRLWYRVAGAADGPTVVFLHGGPGANSQRFASLVGDRLECAVRMVYLDQRGSGRSERPWTDAYSVELLVDDVEGLRQTLGVEQIALIGHSFGTLVALEYAAAHPDHVARVVLAASIPDIAAASRSMCARLAETDPEAHARAVAAAEGDEVCNVFAALSGPEREAFFVANMFPDPALNARIDSIDAAHGLRNTGELSRALFQSGLFDDYRFTAYDRLTMPVLVVNGEYDYQVGREGPEELVRRLPDARLSVYEGGGHFMYAEDPERFAREVAVFLTGARAAD